MALPAKNIERRYTALEFERMPEFNERYELIDGKLVKKPLPQFKHSRIARLIQKAYDRYDPNENRGVMGQEVSVAIQNEVTLVPDVAYWIAARRPAFDVLTAPYPDLAIEIQATDQSLRSLTDKAKKTSRLA